MRSVAVIRRQVPAWLRLARREIGPIALVLVVSIFLLIFRHLAEEVGEGDTRSFDRTVIWALRTPGSPHTPIGPAWLQTAAVDITSLGSVTVLSILVVLVCGMFLGIKHWRQALILFTAAATGLMISQVLKDMFQRDRPPFELHVVPVINTSFPSGHATLSATVFLTMGALIAHFAKSRRMRIYALSAAILLSLLVGVSRVYLGVHWPTDVFAGWCIGAAWALIWWGVAQVWERISQHRLDDDAEQDSAV